jgi:hypothetical protein
MAVGPLSTAETYCGEPPTEHDIRANWKPFWAGAFVPCEACVAARAAAVAEQRRLAGKKGGQVAKERAAAAKGLHLELGEPQPTITNVERIAVDQSRP